MCVCLNLLVYKSNTIISYFIAKYTDIHHLFELSILAGDAIHMCVCMARAHKSDRALDFGFSEKAPKTI